MVNVKISRYQLVFLLVWGILGTGTITIPFAIARFTVRDGWIVAFMFMGTVTFVSGLVWLFNHTFPNDSLFDVFDKVFGRHLGRVAALLGVLWAYVFMCMLVRELNVFVEVTILPETALYIINFAVCLATAYAVYNGIEVVGRLAEVFSIVIIGVFVVLFFLPFRVADLHLLLPVLSAGWTPVLRAAITPDISFAVELMVALQFLHIAKERTSVPRDVLIAGGIITVILLMVDVLVIAVLGPAATYLAFPGLEVVRSIRYGQFIERLDTLLVLVILITMFLKFSLFHFVLCDFMRYSFSLSSTKLIALPAVAAVWAGSLLFFKNGADLQSFMLFVTPVWFATILIGIPVLAIGVGLLKRRLSGTSP